MTDTELLNWKNFIRCDVCHERLCFDSRYEYNDLQICAKCSNRLHEAKKNMLKHPMERENFYSKDDDCYNKKGSHR